MLRLRADVARRTVIENDELKNFGSPMRPRRDQVDRREVQLLEVQAVGDHQLHAGCRGRRRSSAGIPRRSPPSASRTARGRPPRRRGWCTPRADGWAARCRRRRPGRDTPRTRRRRTCLDAVALRQRPQLGAVVADERRRPPELRRAWAKAGSTATWAMWPSPTTAYLTCLAIEPPLARPATVVHDPSSCRHWISSTRAAPARRVDMAGIGTVQWRSHAAEERPRRDGCDSPQRGRNWLRRGYGIAGCMPSTINS